MPRLTLCALIAIALMAGLGFIDPIKLPLMLYKTSMVVLGVVLGYWLDRALFPYARPHECNSQAKKCQGNPGISGYLWLLIGGLATLRRAVIVFACVLGLTFGL